MNVHDQNRTIDDSSALLLEALLNTSVDAIIVIDERGIVRQANLAVERMFGYRPEELHGKNVHILMPSPDREQHQGYIRNYVETGVARIIGIGREVLASHRNGTLFPVDLAVNEVRIQGKRLFVGILRDMTERRRTEEALKREKLFADNLLETANAAVLILHEDGRIARFNHFLERLLGYSNAEVRGEDWFERFVGEEDRPRAREYFSRIMENEPLRYEAIAHDRFAGHEQGIRQSEQESLPVLALPLITRSGQQRIIAWAGRRLYNADEVVHGMLAIGNDITELQSAEQKLIQQERLAAIGQMVTGLAHESRNALQRSRACLDMLELDCGEAPEQLDLIRRIQQALEELQQLYEEVRSYAAPINLERKTCDLTDLCQETWSRLDPQVREREVRLEVHATHSPYRCQCDPRRISQVFRNILENAIAVSPRQATIHTHFKHVAYGNVKAIQVQICDEGPGLTPEQLEKIFEPFYTTKTKGTGLGMPIARRIVESHCGEIWVENHRGKGAEVFFAIPAERETPSASR